MTLREKEILFRLEEKFNAHSELMIEKIDNLNIKIDHGQQGDKELFDKLIKEIYNDEDGLRYRTNTIEKTLGNTKKGLIWFLGVIGTGIGTLILGFFDKLLSLAHKIGSSL